MAVKWVDNSVVNLVSNFVGVEPIRELERWCGKEKVRKNIPCPQTVQQYNKNMGGINLADMLLSLNQTPGKTKRWYQKDILASHWYVNAWILYRRHFCQNGKPHKNHKSLLQFRLELSDALILTNKKPTQALSVADVRFDQVAHWPSPTNKNWCRLCSMTCRMQCSKFKIFLCLLVDLNCFADFHKNHRQISSCIDFFPNRNVLVIKITFLPLEY